MIKAIGFLIAIVVFLPLYTAGWPLRRLARWSVEAKSFLSEIVGGEMVLARCLVGLATISLVAALVAMILW